LLCCCSYKFTKNFESFKKYFIVVKLIFLTVTENMTLLVSELWERINYSQPVFVRIKA